MSKQSRLIWSFAFLGLLVAVLIFVFVYFVGEIEGNLYTGFAILCPSSLLGIPFSGFMKDKHGFYAVWSIIALANAGLYSIVGATVAGLLWRPD